MIIQRISSNAAASNLYIFNDRNYSQVRKASVEPVKSVRKLPGFEEDGEKRKPAAIYQQGREETLVQASSVKQVDAIKNEYALSDKADYNTGNMYERQRMATEGTVLIGMNFDTFA